MRDLTGKTALVTGSASGIGRATALVFAHRGARLILADIDQARGEAAAAEIRSSGAEAVLRPCDVTHSVQVRSLIQAAVDCYGRLDYTFNNAGYEGRIAPTAEYEEGEWHQIVAVNLKSVWLCSNAASFITGRHLTIDGGMVVA